MSEREKRRRARQRNREARESAYLVGKKPTKERLEEADQFERAYEMFKDIKNDQ